MLDSFEIAEFDVNFKTIFKSEVLFDGEIFLYNHHLTPECWYSSLKELTDYFISNKPYFDNIDFVGRIERTLSGISKHTITDNKSFFETQDISYTDVATNDKEKADWFASPYIEVQYKFLTHLLESFETSINKIVSKPFVWKGSPKEFAQWFVDKIYSNKNIIPSRTKRTPEYYLDLIFEQIEVIKEKGSKKPIGKESLHSYIRALNPIHKE